MGKSQIDILAEFIMANVDGEPSQSKGAGDTAIKIIKELQAEVEQKQKEFDYQVGKVNFRDSQLRTERDENRKLQAELDKHRWIALSEGLPEMWSESDYRSKDVRVTDGITIWEDSYNVTGKRWIDNPSMRRNYTHWKLIILP